MASAIRSSYSPRRTPAQPNFLAQSRPRWFISRGENVYSYVIAIDELPDAVDLLGLPRNISATETRGLESLGEIPHPNLTYSLAKGVPLSFPISQPTETYSSPKFTAPDAEVRKARGLGAYAHDSVSERSGHSQTDLLETRVRHPRTQESEATKSPMQAIAKYYPAAAKEYGLWARKPNPSGNVPDQSKKVYCTHYLKYQECAYMQQGCKFEHNVENEQVFKQIGIQTPQWWLEKNAVKITPKNGSKRATDLPTTSQPTWLQQRLAAKENEGRNNNAFVNSGSRRVETEDSSSSEQSDSSGSETDLTNQSRRAVPKRPSSGFRTASPMGKATPTHPNISLRKISETGPGSEDIEPLALDDPTPPDTPATPISQRPKSSPQGPREKPAPRPSSSRATASPSTAHPKLRERIPASSGKAQSDPRTRIETNTRSTTPRLHHRTRPSGPSQPDPRRRREPRVGVASDDDNNNSVRVPRPRHQSQSRNQNQRQTPTPSSPSSPAPTYKSSPAKPGPADARYKAYAPRAAEPETRTRTAVTMDRYEEYTPPPTGGRERNDFAAAASAEPRSVKGAGGLMASKYAVKGAGGLNAAGRQGVGRTSGSVGA